MSGSRLWVTIYAAIVHEMLSLFLEQNRLQTIVLDDQLRTHFRLGHEREDVTEILALVPQGLSWGRSRRTVRSPNKTDVEDENLAHALDGRCRWGNASSRAKMNRNCLVAETLTSRCILAASVVSSPSFILSVRVSS